MSKLSLRLLFISLSFRFVLYYFILQIVIKFHFILLLSWLLLRNELIQSLLEQLVLKLKVGDKRLLVLNLVLEVNAVVGELLDHLAFILGLKVNLTALVF